MSDTFSYAQRQARGARRPVSTGSDLKVDDRTVMQVADRLRDTLRDEVECIRRRDTVRLQDIIAQKSRLTLEFSRLSASISSASLAPETVASLHALRDEVRGSHNTLSQYLEAARAVAMLVGEVVEAAQSDGTYSRADFQPVAAR